MKLEGEGTLLRIYLGELDKHGHQPLYEAIVTDLKIQAFLPLLEPLLGDGLVTMEKVHVIRYRGDAGR